MPVASLSVFLYLFSTLDRLLLANAMGLNVLLSGTSSLGQLVSLLVCSRVASSQTSDATITMNNGLFHHNISFIHLLL